MKKLRKLLIGLAGLSLSVGAAVGVGLNADKGAKEAKATGGATIYLDNAWVAGGADTAKYWVHEWDSSNKNDTYDAWMTPAANGLFTVTMNKASYDSLIFIRVSSNLNDFKWPDQSDDSWNQTGDQTIPGGKNTFKLYDNCTDGEWDTNVRVNVADGTYLVGKYHGAAENWEAVSLSNDKVTESVTYDEGLNKFYATVELYAGDYFKLININRGIQYWETIHSIRSADETYYPHDWNGNNIKVTKAGIYYVTIGFETEGENIGKQWVYLSNSASAFADEFLSGDTMTCDPTGVNEPVFKTEVKDYSWAYFDSYYKGLDTYAKETFYTATNDKNGTNIEKFVSRYFTILANHGDVRDLEDKLVYTQFLTNTAGTVRAARIVNNIPVLSNGDNSNTTLIVVIAISAISILTIGGYFFIRKRKEF